MRPGLVLIVMGVGGYLPAALRYWMGNPKHPWVPRRPLRGVPEGWRLGGRVGMWVCIGLVMLGISTLLVEVVADRL